MCKKCHFGPKSAFSNLRKVGFSPFFPIFTFVFIPENPFHMCEMSPMFRMCFRKRFLCTGGPLMVFSSFWMHAERLGKYHSERLHKSGFCTFSTHFRTHMPYLRCLCACALLSIVLMYIYIWTSINPCHDVTGRGISVMRLRIRFLRLHPGSALFGPTCPSGVQSLRDMVMCIWFIMLYYGTVRVYICGYSAYVYIRLRR